MHTPVELQSASSQPPGDTGMFAHSPCFSYRMPLALNLRLVLPLVLPGVFLRERVVISRGMMASGPTAGGPRGSARLQQARNAPLAVSVPRLHHPVRGVHRGGPRPAPGPPPHRCENPFIMSLWAATWKPSAGERPLNRQYAVVPSSMHGAFSHGPLLPRHACPAGRKMENC